MAYQGSLDGLCGPYAIVNSYHLCDIEEDWLGQDIFELACSTLTGWPDVLWDGTSFYQIRMMLRACQKALQSAYQEADVNYPIEVNYPFYTRIPGTNEEYWDRFEEIFSGANVICGIAGMEHPSEHWFAFTKGRNALFVFDSNPTSWGSVQRIKLEEIHAGVYRMRQFIINRRELIVSVRYDQVYRHNQVSDSFRFPTAQ